jgi:O-antigen ligase
MTMKAALRWILALYIILLGCEELLTGTGWIYWVGVALFMMFLLAFVFRETQIRFSGIAVLMAILAALALSSTFWSVDPDRTFGYAFLLVQVLITTWITASCIEENSNLDLLIWFLVLSSVYPSLSMVRDYLAHGTQIRPLAQYGERLSIAGADPNLNAYRFVVSILAAIHLYLTTPNLGSKMLLAGLAGLFVAASLLTGSRGGATALVVSTLILLLANARHRKGSILLAMAGLAVLLWFAIPYLPPSVAARYQTIGEEASKGSMSGRKTIYREAAESFERRPLLGVGYLAFQSASEQRGGMGKAAHNDPLQVVVDLGLLGLGIYLLLMAALVWKAVGAPAPWKGLALGLFAAYIVSGSSITLLAMKLPWITFGIILGVGGLPGPVSDSGTPVWGRWFVKDASPHG